MGVSNRWGKQKPVSNLWPRSNVGAPLTSLRGRGNADELRIGVPNLGCNTKKLH